MDFGNLATALATKLAQGAAGYTGGQVAADQAQRQMAMLDSTRRFQMALLGLREGSIDSRQQQRLDEELKRLQLAQAGQNARQGRQIAAGQRLVQLRAAAGAGKPLTQAQINGLVSTYVEGTYADNNDTANDLETQADAEPDPVKASALRAQAQKLRSPLTVAAMAQQQWGQDAISDPTTKGLIGNPMVSMAFRAQAQRLLTKKTTALDAAAALLGTGGTGPAPDTPPSQGPTTPLPPAPGGMGPINNGTPPAVAPPAPAPQPKAPTPQPVNAPQPDPSSLLQPSPRDIERAAKDPGYAAFLKQMGWNGQHAPAPQSP